MNYARAAFRNSQKKRIRVMTLLFEVEGELITIIGASICLCLKIRAIRGIRLTMDGNDNSYAGSSESIRKSTVVVIEQTV